MTKLNYRHLDQNYSFVNIYTLVRLQSPSVQSQPHLHKAYTKHAEFRHWTFFDKMKFMQVSS